MQDIWDQYIKQNKKCALTAREVRFYRYSDKRKNTASVDRIDPTGHYTKDNIQIVHQDINYSKLDFDEKSFKQMCKEVTDKDSYDPLCWVDIWPDTEGWARKSWLMERGWKEEDFSGLEMRTYENEMECKNKEFNINKLVDEIEFNQPREEAIHI